MFALSALPLVAAAAAAVAIGYLWYHPRVCGAAWMRFSGMTPEMAERGARHRHLYMLGGFIAALVVASAMRTLLLDLQISDIAGAARFGAAIFVGFAAPLTFGSVLWEHRPFTLYLLNAGYWLLALVAMAITLVV